MPSFESRFGKGKRDTSPIHNASTLDCHFRARKALLSTTCQEKYATSTITGKESTKLNAH